MDDFECIWDLDDDPHGNVWHIAEHGLTPEDVEHALADPIDEDVSRSSGRPIVFGYTRGGQTIAVVYERIDDSTIYPVTAYPVD